MINTYEEAVEWIHSFMPFGIKPGLKRMEWMLNKVDNPHRRLKTIHVAGTNGKGSTVNYMRSILQTAGYEVATFTSPYIETFNERISINGEPIPNDELLQLVQDVKPIVDSVEVETDLGSPTEFEIITFMAMFYFANVSKPDIVLFETGLGGRLDSTNVIYPMLSLITNVSYDHMNILGNELTDIAKEKAGIIKNGVPLITTETKEEVLDVFLRIAKEKKAKVYKYGIDFNSTHQNSSNDGETFTLKASLFPAKEYKISMKGEHQVRNASLAIMAINYLRVYYSLLIEEEDIKRGLLEASWIGRFETVSTNPLVIIDGAHNEEGMKSLTTTLKKHYPSKKKIAVFAANKDKEINEMLRHLYTEIDHITFTIFPFHRAASAKELFETSVFHSKDYNEDYQETLQKRIASISEDEMLIVTGSLYFISEIRKYFKKM
ncbi:bifunctional folylpolyglutamate synthase/dihydrofolate synthase [Lottiidibacillus patelloidae]|uniref:Dihydrofolate synthase/folylpolyglutamate synthase n=1 Tax=Lottiidibacillus patelloidae TaxID=2670334 RepID=A0A263BVY7_9BACI|nr:folylpolyglutamate synthase/dihydrofolate synthase family protein [Lottiidibacillus patelloidae]OZM57875.1 bifunctional folylpolyglutamate synthase/dihydrofolate synthase [Lottiidibacillus patelloidae]